MPGHVGNDPDKFDRHLGRHREEAIGGRGPSTRQEVAQHDPLLPTTLPHRFRGFHGAKLPYPRLFTPHHLLLVLGTQQPWP